jgi:acetyl-CoA synthetase
MIIYTSGTTGKPKGALHTHCGFPVKAAQDMAFGTDVHASDVIYWMTDMGWMMGPWQVFGSLLLGATMFLYDGAPDFPAPSRLWELVEKHGINQMGVSPTLIRSLIPHGDEHFKKHDLSSLKCFASTGEPWNPDPWMWLFEKVGEGKRPIINLLRRYGDLRRYCDGQSAYAVETMCLFCGLPRHGCGCGR